MSEKEEGAAKELYQAPAAVPPSLSKFQEISEKLGFDINDKDQKDFEGYIKEFLGACNIVEKYPQPTLPVKYPRVPGYRPYQEENKYNAWAWKTDIHGASSGKLLGKKVTIKDNIPVAGVPMVNGSTLMDGYIPEFDATVVTRVLDAGGRITGKATCENLCFSGGSFTSACGPVLNPHNTQHSAGGSTSGCAVLVAAGEVDMALGADQGGSIRIPSCWNGIIGLKPTFGLIPYTGIGSMDVILDEIGPMTKTVKDCALLLEVLAGYDETGLDPRQRPDIEVKEYTKACSGNLDGVKIGILKEGFGFKESEPDVDKMVRDAALSLTSVGATVEEVSVPIHHDAKHIWGVQFVQGVYEGMVSAGGTPVGFMGFYPISTIEHAFRAWKVYKNDMAPTMKPLMVLGEYLREQYGNKFYNKAANLRPFIKSKYDEVLKDYDVLIFPTIPFKPTKLPSKDDTVLHLLKSAFSVTTNTAQFSLTGHPALTINTGFSEGLPVGMSILGKYFDESTVLKVAYAFEKIRDAV